MVSVSQPWCAIVSAENAVGIASQPLRTAPPAFQMVRILFSRIALLLLACISSDSAPEAGPLVVELPARDQVLHGARIVARPKRFRPCAPPRFISMLSWLARTSLCPMTLGRPSERS